MAFLRRTRGTALDRDPLDAGKLDNLMLFLKDRLSPDDFAKFTDLIDDLQDDAEEANPSAEMATDALPLSIRRTVRREMRSARLGFSGGTSLAQDSASAKGFNDRFPDAARIQSDPTPAVRMGYTREPRVAMDAARSKSLDERFGTGRIGNAD